MVPSQGNNCPPQTQPLWQQAALLVISGTEPEKLGKEAFSALLEKAIATMRPSLLEQKQMAGNATRQADYIRVFVQAYRSGLPPWSHINEAPN